MVTPPPCLPGSRYDVTRTRDSDECFNAGVNINKRVTSHRCCDNKHTDKITREMRELRDIEFVIQKFGNRLGKLRLIA